MSRTLIGRTVRRLRSERGLSQQALATRLGISASVSRPSEAIEGERHEANRQAPDVGEMPLHGILFLEF